MTFGAHIHRRVPLNEQEATTDLDEIDVDFSDSVDGREEESNAALQQQQQQQQTPPSSLSVQGDVTVVPMSSTTIDMSVVPEPIPKVDAVEPPFLPAYGGIGSIKIIGQHFGTEINLDQMVAINGRACKETLWLSVTTLECVGPPSFTVGTEAFVTVNVARSSSDPSRDQVKIRYEPPIIQRIVPAYGPTHGNTLIRVLGRNFGDTRVSNAVSPTVHIGELPCLNPILINSTEIRCTTMKLDDGQGDYLIKVITDGVSSNATIDGGEIGSDIFTYVLPSIHSVEPPIGPTFGVTRITIRGEGFGTREERCVEFLFFLFFFFGYNTTCSFFFFFFISHHLSLLSSLSSLSSLSCLPSPFFVFLLPLFSLFSLLLFFSSSFLLLLFFSSSLNLFLTDS